MSWNGQVPSDANWQGAPQFPGSEVLYTTPDPATTATNPSIGIIDGNEIPLPTAYNTLNVSGLTATTISGTTANLTTINSVNINNTENINTATINGNPIPTSAELWSLYPAAHNVVGLDIQQSLYVPRQAYALNALVSYAPSPPIYANWKKDVDVFRTINPGNTLDAWTAAAYTRPFDVGCTYNGVQYTTVADSTNQPPPNATYWRLATWNSTTSYSTFDYVLLNGNWYVAGLPAPSVGTSPPGVGWYLQTTWIPYVPVVPDPAWDITNFKTIRSTTMNTGTMNTGTGNALSVVNIGGNNDNTFVSTIGGALYVGKDTTNTSQTKPVVQIGNATVGGSTVSIWGDLNVSEDATVTGNLVVDGNGTVNGSTFTVNADTTLNSGAGALVVNGGTTLDGGTVHGTTIGSLPVSGINSVRIDVLPVGIDIISPTFITIDAVLTANLTSAAATSVSAGGALSLAGGSYIEYNTDQNYFINTSSGNDFTDIYVGNIHPADGGSAPLRINDGTGRGVEIDNGTNWTTTTLNVTNINAPANLTIATISGDIVIDANGNLDLNASTGSAILDASTEVAISSATSYVSLTAAAGQNVKIQSPLEMSNFNIIGANTITGQGALTLATLGGTNLSLSPDTGGQVFVNSNVNMNTNNIVSANTITGFNALTLATTGNNNLNLSPAGTGIIEANKGIDMNSNTIVGASTITGTGALTLASSSNNNINISPAGLGIVEVNAGIDMNNNTIVGASTITGTTTLTLASTGNSNINISPAGTGQVSINKTVNFNSQTLFNMTLTNCDGVYGRPTGALVLVSQQAVSPAVQIRGALTMWANASTQAPGNSIAGLTTLTGQTTLGLATLSNGDLSLSPNGTGTIIANKTLNMNTNAITNLTTLNGRNLFAYGNFYNTASQTLGAINTATRVVMNTSLNNNLITLDTTTNIGRITFTNAGVYHVVWNAYLVHGSGGTAKSVVWIRLNGTDVAGSGKTENNDSQQNETNMTSSSMVSVTAGQYIEFYWAADSVNVPLTAIAAVAPYPATPSFSCTVSIVG